MWLGCTTHIISVLAHVPLFISTYLSQLVHLQLEFTLIYFTAVGMHFVLAGDFYFVCKTGFCA